MPFSSSFPQDLPLHLNDDADISPVNVASPAGEHLLNLSAMHPIAFEQFCWWLLQKEHTLTGCKRLGGNGSEQDGIDLFAYDTVQPDKLIVFECKCWKDYDASKMTKAIKDFLEGDWKSVAHKFVLVLAQKEIGPALGRRWEKEKKRLKSSGIDAELWAGHKLTLKAQAYPDILSKFFPGHCIQFFANEWMERVAFYEELNKALFDPREHISSWARTLVARTSGKVSDEQTFVIDGLIRKATCTGQNWHFDGPWFSLSAILPSQRFSHASAAINFKRPDMVGMTVVLDHKWLLSHMLFASGAPLVSRYRRFVINHAPPAGNDDYVVDLQHCRLTLPEEGVRELAGVADALTSVVKDALVELEKAWEAMDFPFVKQGDTKVALGAIRADAWREMMRFTREHDISAGNGRWHMFDAAPNVLKPFSEHEDDRFNTGYHGVFYVEEIDGLSWDGELILLWQPDGLGQIKPLSPRDWWSCEFAFRWLRDEFLPEVKRWVYNRHFGSPFKRILRRERAARFAKVLDDALVLRDIRQRPLIRNGEWRANIIDTVEALQLFFSIPKIPEPFLRQGDVEALYRVASVLARAGRGYVGYVSSNLCLDDRPADHIELVSSIEQHIQSGRVAANAGVVDVVLRAILELLDDNDDRIPLSDREIVLNALAPFSRVFDEANLVKRHWEWS